jgi:hypothetical protein
MVAMEQLVQPGSTVQLVLRALMERTDVTEHLAQLVPPGKMVQ